MSRENGGKFLFRKGSKNQMKNGERILGKNQRKMVEKQTKNGGRALKIVRN